MKLIPLTQGKFAKVDDEDFDKVNCRKWFARKSRGKYYAASWDGEWTTRKPLHLHHFIAGKPEAGKVTDHLDSDGLNNQKANLRHCTVAENVLNRKAWGISSYRGVSIHKCKGRIYWKAAIGIRGKYIYLGHFKTEIEAAVCYNEAAKKYHGKFAKLNIIM